MLPIHVLTKGTITSNQLNKIKNTLKLSIPALLGTAMAFTLAVNAKASKGDFLDIYKVQDEIKIDGKLSEHTWQKANWQPLNHLIIGDNLSRDDFNGDFALAWDENWLYLVAKFTDDKLFDRYPNPLYRYWDDDCLEIFVDENASGGEHQFNFNAFAYHIALDNQVVDIAGKYQNGKPIFALFNDHVVSQWQRQDKPPYQVVWEAKIRLYNDNYQHEKENTPVTLHKGKQIGFMLAYCDNDSSEQREHFIGSVKIPAINGDKNLGYKTADVFEKYVLSEKKRR